MGQEQIRAAAAMSNRFLDRPVRAMDQDTGVGNDLLELRKTVEDLDPGRKGKMRGRKLFGIIPFGNKLQRYFDSRSEEHTSELQSLMRTSYAVFCLQKKKNKTQKH